MISRRNLGPILAFAGGIVVITAIVVGFVVVGGPGDARDRRLDELTLGRISRLATGVECARRFSGTMPATPDDVVELVASNRRPNEESYCADFIFPTGPERWDDIEYTVLADRLVRICADFRCPSYRDEGGPEIGPWSEVARGAPFPELSAPRPAAGRHCFEIAIPNLSPPTLP